MPGIKKLLPSKLSDNPTRDKLSDFVEEYWHYDNIRKLEEDEFVIDYCSWAKEYDVVRAMQGVGAVLAPRLIAEIGDIRRFHSGSDLVAYASIDAPPFESGSL